MLDRTVRSTKVTRSSGPVERTVPFGMTNVGRPDLFHDPTGARMWAGRLLIGQ